MRRMMILFIALTIAFLIPFLIWGHAWEWSTDQALQQLHRYGALAAPMAFLLLVGDLFLPIPATAVMAGLGWLYGPWLGGLLGDPAYYTIIYSHSLHYTNIQVIEQGIDSRGDLSVSLGTDQIALFV